MNKLLQAVKHNLVKNIIDNMHKQKTSKDLFEEANNSSTTCPIFNKCEICEMPMYTHKHKDREERLIQ